MTLLSVHSLCNMSRFRPSQEFCQFYMKMASSMEGEVDLGQCACLPRLGLVPLARTRRAVEQYG
jgi:hypothetical protein